MRTTHIRTAPAAIPAQLPTVDLRVVGVTAGVAALALAASLALPGQADKEGGINDCAQMVKADATLNQEQMGKLLTVPLRSERATVDAIIGEPLCMLPDVEIRAGVMTTRQFYPIEGKGVIVAFEDGTYTGFEVID